MKKNIFIKFFVKVMRVLFVFLPIKNNRIVLSNFAGKGYGDNPKYITEALIKQKLDYDIVWLTNNTNDQFPKEVKVVQFGSLKAFFMLSTAHIWIDNVRYSKGVRKKKGQYYIQTWHGSYSVKRIEADAKQNLKELYIRSAMKDGSITDLLLSNSKMQTKEINEHFWYSGEIFEKGYPRNDVLINENSLEKINSLKQKMGIANKHVVLFAPTFRDNGDQSPYFINFSNVLSSCKSFFGENTVLLIRFHPNVSTMLKIEDNAQIINVSEYADMQELLIVSDMLITDYSSSMFDYMLIKRTIIVFARDIEEYNRFRGLKSIFFELPFPIAKTTTELNNIIKNYDKFEDTTKISSFIQRYESFDRGVASQSVAKRIEQVVFLQ